MADDAPETTSEHPNWLRKALVGAALAIVVTVVGGVLLAQLTGDDDKSAPNVPAQTPPHQTPKAQPAQPPKDAIEQIARRDIWTTTPETFRSAQEILGRGPFDEVPVDIDRDTLQPTVVTPHQLALHASQLDGQDVVLVGRVVDDISLTPPEGGDGLDHETRLAGSRTSGVYVGSHLGFPPERGETVWVIGRVAAVGRAETLSGRPLRAAYFIAADDFQSTDGDNGGLPGNVRDAVRVQAKRRLQPS